MAILDFFPDHIIALNEELLNHPTLMERLTKHDDVDPELRVAKSFAEIGKYCNVALDGDYTGGDLYKIADIFLTRLRKMREEIIITSKATKIDTLAKEALAIVDAQGNAIVKH